MQDLVLNLLQRVLVLSALYDELLLLGLQFWLLFLDDDTE